MCWADHHANRGTGRAHTERRHRGPASSQHVVRTADDVRVSDEERMAVVAELQRHVGDGRLTLDEFEERADEVMRARTGADLRLVLRELPPPPVDAHRRERPTSASHRDRPRRPVPFWVVVLGVTAAVSLAVGHLVLWPLFLFAFAGCAGGRRSHHRHQPYRTDDPEPAITFV